MKLWGGRFDGDTDKLMEQFSASLPFDKRLYAQDIRGSVAHVNMLADRGIITRVEAARITDGLAEIFREIESGKFAFDLADEDIHMAVERALIEKIGSVGGKLHTARSRNDQVALDVRLYAKEHIADICCKVANLQEVLLSLAEENRELIMPGYTHMQRAQPVLLAHHLMAYFWMLTRDFRRLSRCFDGADEMPLGAAALAGTTFDIDREEVARKLNFARITPNSLDAVSDRDFLAEFIAAAGIVMVHLSRLCEELVLWSTDEFGFLELSDAFTTGSSIMPQKKNPDAAELVRGKTGRVIGSFVQIATVLKGLPLSYNKDLQEDKEALFDTVDTVGACLDVCAAMLRSVEFRADAMRGAAEGSFSTATDLADYLVRRGLPFRDAHSIVGGIVRHCVDHNLRLQHLGLGELRKFSRLFDDEVLTCLDVRTSVGARKSPGGTAPERVAEQIAAGRQMVQIELGWAETRVEPAYKPPTPAGSTASEKGPGEAKAKAGGRRRRARRRIGGVPPEAEVTGGSAEAEADSGLVSAEPAEPAESAEALGRAPESADTDEASEFEVPEFEVPDDGVPDPEADVPDANVPDADVPDAAPKSSDDAGSQT